MATVGPLCGVLAMKVGTNHPLDGSGSSTQDVLVHKGMNCWDESERLAQGFYTKGFRGI